MYGSPIAPLDLSRATPIDRKAMPDAFAFLRLRADVRKCCGIPDNLQIFQLSPTLQLAICVKCGTRHRRMIAEPGQMFGDSNG